MSLTDYVGQWIHRDIDGFVRGMVDLDLVDGSAIGHGYFYPVDATPALIARVQISCEDDEFDLKLSPEPFDPRQARYLNDAERHRIYGQTLRPKDVTVKTRKKSRNEIVFETEDPSSGPVSYFKCELPDQSSVGPESDVTTWRDFREKIDVSEFRRWVFRGQKKDYPLQTTFHRSSRKDLIRYYHEDVQLLNHAISGRVQHLFDINLPRDFGALLNLAQHHGFPTPLLDWTYSPFVAAWFAYKDVVAGEIQGKERTENVRIFAIDRKEFARIEMFANLTLSLPHTSMLDALPIENERAIPQQGVLMLTNLQDVEAHIKTIEKATSKHLIKAYDLPIADAEFAMRDLASMGISRSTMMPGIESTCFDLTQQLFNQ